MKNSSKPDKGFICHDCFKLNTCRDSVASWVFFVIAIIATISIRAVNVVLDFNPLLAKFFWYAGVSGFFLFFIYKFRHNAALHRELEKSNLTSKLLSRSALSEQDYEILGTIICHLRSKKDKINYFFIFFFSGLALILAVYFDFFKGG